MSQLEKNDHVDLYVKNCRKLNLPIDPGVLVCLKTK